MNCHENNNEKKTTHKHSPLKHMLHMIICCGLPIVLVAVLPFIAKISPSAAGVVNRIVPFICPIMMVSMVFMMMGNNKKGNCCENHNENQDSKQLTE